MVDHDKSNNQNKQPETTKSPEALRLKLLEAASKGIGGFFNYVSLHPDLKCEDIWPLTHDKLPGVDVSLVEALNSAVAVFYPELEAENSNGGTVRIHKEESTLIIYESSDSLLNRPTGHANTTHSVFVSIEKDTFRSEIRTMNGHTHSFSPNGIMRSFGTARNVGENDVNNIESTFEKCNDAAGCTVAELIYLLAPIEQAVSSQFDEALFNQLNTPEAA